ncbi:MAG: molybdopterin-dependent oxidoreductase [Planctomycetes bacterium]|nr:molybdopterin-dependent oxidoreductase [Planctomycetota bacterium]
MTLIGQRIPKLDAADKATGRSRYIQDLRLPGLLEARVLRSTVPHGRIVSVDVSRAREAPGVFAVLASQDIPPKRYGYAKDTTALKGDRVRRIGDEIAAVAAVDADAAAEALDLIRFEIEPLPAVFDPERTLDPGAPLVHEDRGSNLVRTHDYAHGRVEEGFARAAHVVEGTFRLPAQAHGCLGPAGAVAEWDARGRLTLHDPTQIPFLIQRDLADTLGIPPSDLRIIQPTIAGGFGARLDLYPHEIISALLARAAGRPVRLAMDREEDFATDPVRPRTVVRMRTAAAADGALLAREADVIVDCGAYVSWGAVTPIVMMHTMGSFYRVPHVKYRARTVYTNTAPTGAFRGFGNPEITFAIESQMDELAARIGIDPVEMRLRNANQPGEVTPQGSRITSCGMKECLEAVRERMPPPGTRPPGGRPLLRAAGENLVASATQTETESPSSPAICPAGRIEGTEPARSPLRRGIGVAAVFHVGGGARIYRSDGCGAMVKIDDFGKATVVVGATDIGQGMETVAAQMAAEELGVPLEAVRIAPADTDVRPWDVGVHASRTTFIAGNAVRAAAKDAKRQIEAARTALGLPPDTPYDKVVRSEHFRDQGSLVIGRAYFDPPNAMVDAENKGNVSAAYVFGAHAAEVEVDVETGQVRVLRVVAAHDVGRAINPMYVEGQIEGGVMQGIGYALLEEVILREGGMSNPNFLDYRMPGPQDMPSIETVIVETNDPSGPFGAKGIGEPPLVPVAAAIANAVANATGVRLRELPMTPERVWRALRAWADVEAPGEICGKE